MTTHTNDLDKRRKRLIWRANHRGMKEMDVILGGFAERALADMSEGELDAFESILEMPDPDLYAWIVGGADVPAEHDGDLMRRLRAFRLRAEDYGGSAVT